ncbi:MAG: hypothetical protein GX881_08610 [Firmicutes bacterium]|nr:hypothetical protein [Bacillota bacterium]
MNILEMLDGVIRKPVSALNAIAREKPVGWALGIFAAATLLNSLTADYAAMEELFDLQAIAPYMAVVQVISALAGLFVSTGILYLLSLIFKGSGSFWSLFSALGFAQFPIFLNPIGALLGKVGGVAAALGGLLTFGVGIWVMVLNVIALRESRSITTGASIGVYLIIIFTIGIVVTAVAVMFILAMGGAGGLHVGEAFFT